jgi:hypothetical protein
LHMRRPELVRWQAAPCVANRLKVSQVLPLRTFRELLGQRRPANDECVYQRSDSIVGTGPEMPWS